MGRILTYLCTGGGQFATVGVHYGDQRQTASVETTQDLVPGSSLQLPEMEEDILQRKIKFL